MIGTLLRRVRADPDRSPLAGKAVLAAASGHVLARGTLTGTYER